MSNLVYAAVTVAIQIMKLIKRNCDQSVKSSILDYDWPTPSSADAYFIAPGAAVRGSVRFCDNRIVGSDEVQKNWKRDVAEVQKMLGS